MRETSAIVVDRQGFVRRLVARRGRGESSSQSGTSHDAPRTIIDLEAVESWPIELTTYLDARVASTCRLLRRRCYGLPEESTGLHQD